MNTPQFREQCAAKLDAAKPGVAKMTGFVGLDGFVDEIVHAVDTRESATEYHRLGTITQFAERIAAAAGKSTNIELVSQQRKHGGNGPIMGNALATLGLKVTYVGSLGYPHIHPVFKDFTERAEVHSISDAGYTHAVEFEDGKVMLVKSLPLNEVTWAHIDDRFGVHKFVQHFATADLVAFVNWTMIPFMSDIWQHLQQAFCPMLTGRRRILFFDLADPEKRPAADIARALRLIVAFQQQFDVVLGLNEKEACEVGEVVGFKIRERTPQGLSELTREIRARVPVHTLVVHPTTYALACTGDVVDIVEGPIVRKPLITTGAGDHFNSGFCMGKLLGLSNAESLLTGVSTSGYYVGNARTPNLDDLSNMMRHWPS